MKRSAAFSSLVWGVSLGIGITMGVGCATGKSAMKVSSDAPAVPAVAQASSATVTSRDIAPVEAADVAPAVEAAPAPQASPTQAAAPAPAVEPASIQDLDRDLGKIPTEMNEHVAKWIQYFTQKDRERFGRFLARGSQYREVIEDLLEENEVPAELYFLAMIESGFSTRATSSAKAVGTWQFMPATGRRYGLEVDAFVDERVDPIRSTEAAAKYLKDLHNVFGSWYLAMAAYNAGEYRIVGSVVRGKSRDFWTLVKRGVLPAETADYVPKFLAAVLIGQNPEKYGFEVADGEKYPDLEAVEVPSPIRLSDISATTGIPLSDLQRVNPHLKKGMTPPGISSYELWVPEASATTLQGASASLASLRVPFKGKAARMLAVADAQGASRNYHVVRSGEGLAKIARKYKVSVAYLKKVNGLHSDHLRPGTKIRLTAKAYHPKPLIRYRVRRGDSLHAIARRFGVSIQQLKRENGLEGRAIHVGQVLKIASNR